MSIKLQSPEEEAVSTFYRLCSLSKQSGWQRRPACGATCKVAGDERKK
jgi:hypothetical protein